MHKRLSIVTLFPIVVLLFLGLLQVGCGSGTNASGQTSSQTSSTTEANAKELYRQALASIVSAAGDNTSGSVEIDADSTKFKGQVTGTTQKEHFQGSMDINENIQGMPISMSTDIIGIGTGNDGQSDLFMKIKSVSAPGAARAPRVQAGFAPVLNKWVKMNDKNQPEKPTTFENDGAFAALDLVSWFLPLDSLNDSDKNIFLSSVDKNDPYEVASNIENTQFQGTAARLIKVTIKKAAIIQIDKEVAASISKAADFKLSDPTFIDEVFGKNDTLSADVYLSPDEPKIIGADIQINLDKPVGDSSFNTTFSKVTESMLVKYDQALKINPPDSFITEAQMVSLMLGGARSA